MRSSSSKIVFSAIAPFKTTDKKLYQILFSLKLAMNQISIKIVACFEYYDFPSGDESLIGLKYIQMTL